MDIGYTESIPMNHPCRSNNAAARISQLNLTPLEFRTACDSTGARDELAMLVQDNRAQKVTIQNRLANTDLCCEHRAEQAKANLAAAWSHLSREVVGAAVRRASQVVPEAGDGYVVGGGEPEHLLQPAESHACRGERTTSGCERLVTHLDGSTQIR